MAIAAKSDALKQDDKEIAAYIASLVKGIRFGSVEIVIHDGRIAHIDKRERFRINEPKS